MIDKDFRYFLSEPRLYKILNFAINDIDERIVEMSSCHSLTSVEEDISTRRWTYQYMGVIKQTLSLNTFAHEIKPSTFVPRLIRDDLPGYYLGVYSPGAQNHDAYFQKVERSKDSITRSMNIQLYMSTPDSFTVGKEHTIEITSKPYQTDAEHPGLVIEYHYLIKITRTTTSMVFKYFRGPSTLVGSLTLNYPSGGTGNKFVYFSLTVGHGMLFFKDSTTFRARRYQTLHVYQPGTGVKLRDHQTLDEDMTEKEMRFDENERPTTEVWAKVEFKPAPGITNNEAFIRVYISGVTNGVYPSFLISSRAVDPATRCYFEAYHENSCVSLGILVDADETQAPKGLWFAKLLFNPPETYNLKETCKVLFDPRRCLIPKPGYITNLENKIKTAFYPGSYTISDYENLREEVKKTMRVYTNNVGTKYLVTCPISCNPYSSSFLPCFLVLNFFRWNM